MKRALLACFAVGVLAVLTGCNTDRMSRHGNCVQAEYTCADAGCGRPGCPHCGHHCEQAFDPGPPTGAITYPYYTLRGPRDFLMRNPPPIGP
jgi:hypothetical protein